jgi:hypothetical protein
MSTNPPTEIDTVVRARRLAEQVNNNHLTGCTADLLVAVTALCDEVERLRRGEFTSDEFQNLCHNLDETKRSEFFAGCAEFQRKLFGISAVEQALEIFK